VEGPLVVLCKFLMYSKGATKPENATRYFDLTLSFCSVIRGTADDEMAVGSTRG